MSSESFIESLFKGFSKEDATLSSELARIAAQLITRSLEANGVPVVKGRGLMIRSGALVAGAMVFASYRRENEAVWRKELEFMLEHIRIMLDEMGHPDEVAQQDALKNVEPLGSA